MLTLTFICFIGFRSIQSGIITQLWSGRLCTISRWASSGVFATITATSVVPRLILRAIYSFAFDLEAAAGCEPTFPPTNTIKSETSCLDDAAKVGGFKRLRPRGLSAWHCRRAEYHTYLLTYQSINTINSVTHKNYVTTCAADRSRLYKATTKSFAAAA